MRAEYSKGLVRMCLKLRLARARYFVGVLSSDLIEIENQQISNNVDGHNKTRDILNQVLKNLI